MGSNKEAIAVNQAWAGHSGSPFKSSETLVTLDEVNHGKMEKGMTNVERAATGATTAPSWEYFYKPMEANGDKTAVFLMNHGDTTADLTLDFADVPGVTCTKCAVRDIWAHKDLGTFTGSYVAKDVASHDSPFLIITPSTE